MRYKSGVSRSVVVVVSIVIIIIVAAGGYVLLAGMNSTTTSSTTTAEQTSTTSALTTTSQLTTTSSASSVISNTPFTFTVPHYATIPSAVPFLIMQQQGILAGYDPNATETPNSNDAQALQEVESGQAQVGVASYFSVLTAIGKGQNLTMLGVVMLTPPFQVVVSASSNITSPDQLSGGTWSTSTPGSVTYISAHIVAQRFNLGNISDNIIPHPIAEVEAVIAGKATACVAAPAVIATYPSNLIRLIYNVTGLGYSSGWTMFSTESFASAHPNAVKAAMAATQKAGGIFNANVNNASINILLNSYPNLSVNGARKIVQVAQYPQDEAFSLSQLQQSINVLYQFKVIQNNMSSSSVITQGLTPTSP